jgi:hypothetical protein
MTFVKGNKPWNEGIKGKCQIGDKNRNWKGGVTKERRPSYTKRYQAGLRKAAIDILGGKCIRCGFDDIRALQIDHINGGGNIDIKNIRGNYHRSVIQSVLNNERKYQLLCANCNWIKRAENNELRK